MESSRIVIGQFQAAYTPEVEMTELYLYRRDIGAGNKTQGIHVYISFSESLDDPFD